LEVPGSIPRHYKEKEVVGLERGPLSLVSATEELLGGNSSGFGVESREYSRRDSSRWPRGTLYPQKKLALTSLTCGGRSVGIVRLRTEAKFFFNLIFVIRSLKYICLRTSLLFLPELLYFYVRIFRYEYHSQQPTNKRLV
jgi:hypothetical protein